jgi:hypothetical protein
MLRLRGLGRCTGSGSSCTSDHLRTPLPMAHHYCVRRCGGAARAAVRRHGRQPRGGRRPARRVPACERRPAVGAATRTGVKARSAQSRTGSTKQHNPNCAIGGPWYYVDDQGVSVFHCTDTFWLPVHQTAASLSVMEQKRRTWPTTVAGVPNPPCTCSWWEWCLRNQWFAASSDSACTSNSGRPVDFWLFIAVSTGAVQRLAELQRPGQ